MEIDTDIPSSFNNNNNNNSNNNINKNPNQNDAIAFGNSSQLHHWMFKNQEELNNIRRQTIANSPKGNSKLTLEDEVQIRMFYQRYIQTFCKSLNFPDKIQASSIIFFQRFYLSKNILQVNPRDIMLTCIYLACKVEESYMSAEDLLVKAAVADENASIILQNELVVLQGLSFHLNVYHPYRPLYGLVADMQEKLQAQFPQAKQQIQSELHTLWEKSRTQIHNCMLTDILFLYPPSQIALACMQISSRVSGNVNVDDKGQMNMSSLVDKYIDSLLDGHPSNQLHSSLKEICLFLEQPPIDPKPEEVTKIARKYRTK